MKYEKALRDAGKAAIDCQNKKEPAHTAEELFTRNAIATSIEELRTEAHIPTRRPRVSPHE